MKSVNHNVESKTEAEFENDILNITMKIHTEFPELSKYIAELPEKDLGIDSLGMQIENFKEYYKSLQDLLLRYSKTHPIGSKDKA